MRFACESDREASDQLRLRIFKDGCSGRTVYDELLAHGDEAPSAPSVKPGIYGFQAMALRDGMPLAESCVLAALPPRAKLELRLSSEACEQGLGSPPEDDPEEGAGEGGEGAPGSNDAGAAIDADAPSQVLDPPSAGPTPVPTTPGAAVAIECGNTAVALASCGVCGRMCAADQSCQNGACRPSVTHGANCTAQRFRDHDYLFCEDKHSWSAARKLCRDFGFGLASIEDKAENDFIARFVGKVDRWIGANDIGANDIGINDLDIGINDFGLGNVASSCAKVAGPVGEGNWYWASKKADISNETAFCAFADAKATGCVPIESRYQNFNLGEPDNAGCTCLGVCLPGEDCGMFLAAKGSWSDRACLTSVAYVCESP